MNPDLPGPRSEATDAQPCPNHVYCSASSIDRYHDSNLPRCPGQQEAAPKRAIVVAWRLIVVSMVGTAQLTSSGSLGVRIHSRFVLMFDDK